jgi:hypothetical protein
MGKKIGRIDFFRYRFYNSITFGQVVSDKMSLDIIAMFDSH